MTMLINNRQEVTNNKVPQRLQDYLNEFKVLRQPSGYTLIEIDFSSKFGMEKADSLIQKWPTFRRKIVHLLQKSSVVKDPVGKTLVDLLLKNKDNDTDAVNLILIQLLPSFVPPMRTVKFGKKKLKPSLNDCRESLICKVNTVAQVKNFIADKRSSVLQEFGPSASVQSYLLIVGSDTDKSSMERVYVCVDNFTYVFSNIIQALDMCFKSYFSFDLTYPVLGYEVWVFIQKYLYELDTPDDVEILNVKSFIQRMNLIKLTES